MNYSDFRFTLDVQSNVSQVSLPVKLNDTGRRLLINLTDGGEPYNISAGSIAYFSYKKAEPNDDGEYEAGILDCIIEDNFNTIRFDFLPEVTSVAGVVDCEIWLYGPNGRQIASPRFIIVVDERVMSGDDYPLPEDKLSVLDSILTSEASRVEAEKARETACAEAVENANNSARLAELAARDAEQAEVSANSAVENLYKSLNEMFPTPTKNTESKLTEAGYYAVYALFGGGVINFGVFYYHPNSYQQTVENGGFFLRIESNGSLGFGYISRAVSADGQVSSNYILTPDINDIYTAKL